MLGMSARGTLSSSLHSKASATPSAAAGPNTRRAEAFGRLADGQFDLLVVGGGITGCGIARDAAMRGLRVALVERDDFGSGTSSRSSRLIHGGVRYLEHGWLRLVFEASRERRILLRIAPHLVRPLVFTWPVYRRARVPLWKLRAGLGLYDALALFRNVARHSGLSVAGVAEAEPELRRDRLTGGARYHDAATDDARLTLANAIAAGESGAVVVNHAAIVAFRKEDGRVIGAMIRDEATGASSEIAVRAVVNAGGPWSDEIRALDDGSAVAAVRGTKGVHISVPRHRVGNRDALTLLSPIDGRVFFVLPAGAHTIIGTTDTFTRAHPTEVRADEEDVKYLTASANAFFPNARLTPADVVAAWAGIRPLIAEGAARDEGDSSREHALHRSASGVFSITGGKLTTYRSMAAEVVDDVVRANGDSAGRASTDRVALPGGDIDSPESEARDASAACGDAATGAHLARAYGSRWRDVWALSAKEPSLNAHVAPGLPYTLADFVWGVEREMATTLADLLMRRTTIAYELPDQARSLAPRVARTVASRLGWSHTDVEREIATYEREAERVFAIDP